MELSIRDLDVLISALGAQDAEFGLREPEAALLARLLEVRERRIAEAREYA